MPRNWYTIESKAESTDAVEISIYGAIGATWDGEGTTAAKFVQELREKAATAKSITLYMNSPGGSLFDGIAIHNALAMHGAEITGKVMGVVASAGSYIMLACTRVEMPANTFQMVHNISSGMFGTAAEMQEWVDTMNRIDKSVHATYASRTGKTVDEIAKMLSKDTWLTAAECLEMGLCEAVVDSINVSAKYESEALPVAVQTALGLTVEPTAEQVVADATALPEQIIAAFGKAGLDKFGAHFALSLDSLDGVPAAVAKTRDIVALCKTAGKPDRAAGFVAQDVSLGDVRATLVNERATEDEKIVIDTARKSEVVDTESRSKQGVTAASVYEKRRKQTAQATN